MTSEEWLEKFTGLKVATGASIPGDLSGERADLQEKEQLTKQVLLASVWNTLNPIKPRIQKAMESKVSTGGILKERMLKVGGTSEDEAEFEEIDISSLEQLPKPIKDAIVEGQEAITICAEKLKTAKFKRLDKDGKYVTSELFSVPELQDLYWTPLNRERILPETFIGNVYSRVQQMITETNEAYLEGVQEKKALGQLTERNLVKTALDIGSELVGVAGSITEAANGGKAGVELALKILEGVQVALTASGQVYEKLAAKQYGDAAQVGLDGASALCGIFLKQAGLSDGLIQTVQGSLKLGGQAIKAGQKFATANPEEVGGGLEIVGSIFEGALQIAASDNSVDPKLKDALGKAGTLGAGAIKGLSRTPNLIIAIKNGDVGGVAQFISAAAQDGLKGLQAFHVVDNKEAAPLSTLIDTAGKLVPATLEAAIAMKRGNYLAALNKMISGIGDGLSATLELSGVPSQDAGKIGAIYSSVTAGAQVLTHLAHQPDPQVAEALEVLGSGFAEAMKKAAGDNQDLQKAGATLKTAMMGIAGGIQMGKLIKAKKFDEAMAYFNKEVSARVNGFYAAVGVVIQPGSPVAEGGGAKGEEPAEEEGEALSEEEQAKIQEAQDAFTSGLKKLGPAAQKAGSEIEANLQQAALAESIQEADDIIAEAKEDAKAMAKMSEAEKLGLEASNIDALIAKVALDRMITKIAVQIMSGGAAFAASFVPGLGAVSAGVKLAANMVAAGERAYQLSRWVNNQRDFAAAQNALSSSARNFVRNQAEQFAHYTIQACFEAATLIGEVLKLGGVTSAAGQGLALASQIGNKLEAIFQKTYGVVKLEIAWKTTKASIRNPTNRKLALKARAQNPTLAKYSIAYGAVVKKDALAQNALSACNLTQAVLESENANVSKVVTYLETFYQDDDKLYREVRETRWVPAELNLSLRSWTKLKSLAETNIQLTNAKTDALDGLLALIKVPIDQLDDAALEARIGVLEDLAQALENYSPISGDPVNLSAAPMAAAVKILTRQAKDQAKGAALTLKTMREEAAARQLAEQKAQAERAELLKNNDKVLEFVALRTALIGGMDGDTELSEMQATQAEIVQIVQDINTTPALKSSPEITQQVLVLVKAQRILVDLIATTQLRLAA